MKRTLTLSLLAALLTSLAAPTLASPGSPRGFQLQPAPTPSPSNTPEIQGPVDSDAPIATRPREIVTPNDQTAPAEGASNETPPPATDTATVSRPVIQPIPEATRAVPQRSTAQRPPSRAQNPPSAAIQPTTVPTTDPTVTTPLPDSATAPPVDEAASSGITPGVPAPAAELSENPLRTIPTYLWWLAGLTLLMLLCIGGAVWWRQRAPLASSIPTIEPPLARAQKSAEPADTSTPTEPAAEAATDAETTATAAAPSLPSLPIQIKAEAISLSRSIMNTALSYRFEFMNIGGKDLEEISISADMISAHGKAPIDEQVAHAGSELPFVSIIAAIKKGSSQDLKGELRLPVGSIRWIAQGPAKLYVPLLRLRVEAEGLEPVIHTFVVGIRPQAKNGKLLPFRLDEMAQTYQSIGFRALT